MEGKGGRRRIREGWKEHEREGGRVKREEPRRRNCDSRLAYLYLQLIFIPGIQD